MAGIPAGRLSIEIVAEIARLQTDLDKAKRMVNAASGDMAKSAKAANDNIGKMGGTSKLASHQVTNLAYQVQDLGVQFAGAAASGKPLQGVMMALVQQGPQIAMIMKDAGIGAKGLAAELGGMVGRFAAAHPYLTAFVAVVGVAAAAMKIFTAELNGDRRAELDAYANSLGLTAEEMEKLGPLTIGLGDLFTGLGKTFSDEIGINMPNVLDGFKAKFLEAFNAYLAISRTVTSGIYAGFVGTFNGIKSTWSSLPAILGEATIGAANGVIRALNYLLQKGTQYINTWSAAINSVLGAIPGFEGTRIGTISAPQISEISNQFAGAGKSAAGAFMDAYSTAFKQAEATQKRIGQSIVDNTVQAAKDGYAAEAGKLIDDRAVKKLKDSAGKAGKKAGEEAADKFAEAWAKRLAEWRIDLISDVMKQVTANENSDFEGFMRRVESDIEQPLYEAAKAAEVLANRVDALVYSLGNMKGIGGVFGDLADIFTSKDPIASLLSMGGFGTAIGGILSGGAPFEKIAKDFETTLRTTFGVNGWFADAVGENLGSVLQGLGIGSAVGGVVFDSKNAQIGSSIGGVLGDVAGKAIGKAIGPALGKLAGALGPLGAIAGSLLGGVLGGLLDSNRTANAVVTGSGFTVGGKDKGNYSAANDLGSAVQEGLNKIADTFGATIGNFLVSIGVRGDQVRVNTGGTSLKFDQGAVGFGQDAEKAVMFAIASAIEQGALEGLSAGIQKLITSGGDLESQLQKALSFQSVFDELSQLKDPQAEALKGLETWKTSLDAIFVEAGATGEELAKLEELYGIKRASIAEQYAQEALERDREIRDKTIELLVAQGKIEEAEAAARQARIDDAPEYLRAIQEEIELANQAATATAKANAIAQERAGLEQRLWQLQGNTTALREREREALNPLNRDLYDLINAMEDWQTQVQKSQSLFDSQSSLEQQILGLKADVYKDPAAAALALKLAREAELRAADATLRPLLLVKYALEDLGKTADAVAEEVRKAAEKQKAIDDELGGLNKQWLELIGDTATLRQMTLDGLLSDDARNLQQKIWDYTDAQAEAAKATEDAQKAQEAYAQSLAAARDTLAQAYERESSALQGTIDKFRGFADTIRGFRKGLFNSDNPAIAFAQTRGQFQSTARMASLGSEKALGAFTGDAQAYLDAAKNNAGSLAEYQSIIAEVARAANLAERGASGVASEAQRQLDLMTEQVAQFIDLNENVVTVADAITALTQIQQVETTPAITDALSTGLSQVTEAVSSSSATSNAKTDTLAKLLEQALAELRTHNQRERNYDGGNFKKIGSDPDTDSPVRTLEVTP